MQDSKIEWTSHTFNPWIGCTKVSPGCTNCYAEARDQRFAGGIHWGKGAPRQRTSASNWKQPLKWNRESATARGLVEFPDRPLRHRVFCASLADWLDDEVPIEWLADLLKLIHDTPNLDWLLLTKRPENWRARVCAAHFGKQGEWALATAMWLAGNAPANVWIGTTVEDQQRADERIPELLKIPARVRFLSCEPLLGPVDLEKSWAGSEHDGNWCSWCGGFTGDRHDCYEPKTGIHWVICGGESGHGARPFHVDWARSLRDQCNAAGVAFFMKQLGCNVVGQEMDKWVTRLDSKSKNGDMEKWPSELRVREFPKLAEVSA